MSSKELVRESSSDGMVINIGKNLEFGVSLGKVAWNEMISEKLRMFHQLFSLVMNILQNIYRCQENFGEN